MSSSQLNKLKPGIKNSTEVTLNISSNVIADCSDETNFPYKLLLTDTQVSRLRKVFANGSSTNMKLSKTQLSKKVQLGGFLGKLFGSLVKTALPFIKNMLKPPAKSILISLRLTAAASATDPAIEKKIYGSGMASLIISNKE